jgi:hypothetical protein
MGELIQSRAAVAQLDARDGPDSEGSARLKQDADHPPHRRRVDRRPLGRGAA